MIKVKKRGLMKVLGISLLVLILLGAVIVLYLSNISVDIGEVEIDDLNTAVYTALIGGLLDDALVDIQDEKVIVAYKLETDLNELYYLYYTLGVVHNLVPSTKTVEVVSQIGNKETTYKVPMQEIIDFMNDKLTEEEFDEKIIKS